MASIRGMSSPVKGKVFEVSDDAVTIGRGSENQICVADTSVSTSHCVIKKTEGKGIYTLRDLGSTNGTRRNGEVVQVARLKPKDIIQVGSVDLMFDGTDVEVEPESGPRDAARPSSGKQPDIDVRTPETAPLSSAFGRKRDHRRVVNAVVYAIAGLALAALLVFILMLLRVRA